MLGSLLPEMVPHQDRHLVVGRVGPGVHPVEEAAEGKRELARLVIGSFSFGSHTQTPSAGVHVMALTPPFRVRAIQRPWLPVFRRSASSSRFHMAGTGSACWAGFLNLSS